MQRVRAASVCLALVSAALGGCAAIDRDVNAEAIAKPASLKRMTMKTDAFVLTAFVRIGDPKAPVNVYIEGDGLAWLSRTQISLDPTPKDALGLSLAAADPSPNVVYVARPCQFTPRDKNPNCDIAYWTGRRFGPDVIASMSQAVDQVVAQAPGQKVNLVGYSGGGAVAVLVAANRKDVASIRTVAGNLDHVETNRLHGVSPLFGSLNAIDAAPEVADIPQIHFSGAADATVPPAVAERFRQAVGTSCVAVKTIQGATHEAGWRERWRELLGQTPKC
jgi:pimeloyl-ACP methyl ester carboxylesterase